MQSLLATYGGGAGESKKREQSGGVGEESGLKKAKAVTSEVPAAPPPPPQRSSLGFDSSDEEDQGEDEFEPKKQLKTGAAMRQPAKPGSIGKPSTMFVPPQVRSGRPNKITEDTFK
jgi:hypothetical protein